MNKNQFEFHFPPLKKANEKTNKTEKKSKEGSKEKQEEQVKKEPAKPSEVATSKKDIE